MNTTIKSALIMALVLAFTANIDTRQRNNNFDKQRGQRFDRQERIDNFRHMRAAPQQRMVTLLDLSDEQLEQMKQLRIEGQKEMLPLRNQLREKHARLRTLTTAANYDNNAVNKLITEIGDIRTQMLAKRLEHRQEMRLILTEEQRVTFDTMHSRRAFGSGKFMQRGFKR